MTFQILTERLQKLRTLAGIIHASEREKKLYEVLAELKSHEKNEEVTSELLNALRRRLLTSHVTNLSEMRMSLPDKQP